MIETVTGESYASYCSKTVLKPAGATTASLSPLYSGFAAWGGWEMSAADYQRIATRGLGPETGIGRDPFRFPHAEIGQGMFYGPGIVFRKFRDGHNFWHFGAYCMEEHQAGTFFVQWQGRLAVTVLTDSCFDEQKMISLDAALVKAVFQ